MTEKEVLAGLLSKTLNMDESAVASLYNEDESLKDDALTTILNFDAERITKLKTQSTERFNDGHKKGKQESLTAFEREVLEKFGIKSEKKGLELIQDILEQKAKESGKPLADDEIKKHPYVTQLIDRLTKEKEDAIAKNTGEFETFKKEISAKETFGNVAKKANELFYAMKPILPTDPNIAKNQEELFLSKIREQYQYEVQGDKIILLDKEGKVLEDAHGNRVPFEKAIRDIAGKFYEFHKADQKAAPGNGKSAPNGKPVTISREIPKTREEYNKLIVDASIPVEERLAIKEAYTSANPSS